MFRMLEVRSKSHTQGAAPIETRKLYAIGQGGNSGTITEQAVRALSEEELVDLARSGNVTAFGELIQRHYNSCLKRAMLMIRNRGDAEDEVQNACW